MARPRNGPTSSRSTGDRTAHDKCGESTIVSEDATADAFAEIDRRFKTAPKNLIAAAAAGQR
jgi:hypothetical protein